MTTTPDPTTGMVSFNLGTVTVDTATKTSESQNWASSTMSNYLDLLLEQENDINAANNLIMANEAALVKTSSDVSAQTTYQLYAQQYNETTQDFTNWQTIFNNDISNDGKYVESFFSAISSILTSLAATAQLI